MSRYKDYGYRKDNRSIIADYVLIPLLNQLDENINKCILDVGCGNGWLVSELVERGFDAYGIDASPSGIQIAAGRLPDRFYVQNVTTKKLPAEIASKRFDTVVSTEVIEHLYDPEEFLDFIAGILSKSEDRGELIITTPYHGYLKYLALALSGKMDQHLQPQRVGGHIKFFSKRTILKMLNEHGFAVEHFQGCGRLPLLWKSMLIKAVVKSKQQRDKND